MTPPRCALPLAIFVLLALLLAGPSLSGRREMVPWDNLQAYAPWRDPAAPAAAAHNALISDIVFQSVVWQRQARRAFLAGERLRWNPDALLGLPYYSGLLHGLRYPPNRVWRWIEPSRTAAWLFAGHLVLGAFFACLLARRLGASPCAATAAGVVYVLSAPVYLNMTFHTMQGALAWLPACVWSVLALAQSDAAPAPGETGGGRLRRAARLAAVPAVHALVMLSGHPEVPLHAFLLSGGLAGWLALAAWHRRRPHTVAVLAAAMVLATAAAWVIVRPELPALRSSFRAGTIPLSTVRSYALPAYQAVTLLAPNACGSPVLHRYFDPLCGRWQQPAAPITWGDKNAVEGTMYVGLLALALLLLPAARRQAAFFRVFLLLALLLAFGTPLYALFYHGVPFANQLRSPFRWLIPATLCTAMLTAQGLQAWLDGCGGPGDIAGRRLRLLGWLMVATACGGLLLVPFTAAVEAPGLAVARRILEGAGRVRQAFPDARAFLHFAMGQALGTGVRLAAAGALLLGVSQPAVPRRRGAWLIVAGLTLELFLFARPFYTHAPASLGRAVPPAIAFLQAQPGRFRVAVLGSEHVLPPNTAALYGLQDIRAYDSILPRACVDFLSRLEPQTRLDWNIAGILEQPATLDSPWLDFLNVGYVLSETAVTNAGWTLCHDGRVRIYRNAGAFPRYYLAADLAATFEDGPPPPLPQGRCEVVDYTPGRVTLETDCAVAAWLVSSETDYGQWRAAVDGRPAAGQATLGLFRCVRLPPGRHRVEWGLRGR